MPYLTQHVAGDLFVAAAGLWQRVSSVQKPCILQQGFVHMCVVWA